MPDFITIHTAAGLAAMARAEATGSEINLTHMAVGDGNGNPVTPTEGQATLVREMFRAPINRVFPAPSDPRRFTAELVIPATEGGFVMREVGVFDADGTLFAVGNLPETYKPEVGEGAFSDTVVRLEFMVANAGVITLQVDPNVAVASQQWITNNITAATIIPGGTTNEVLSKVSNADGDYEWRSAAAGVNITVDTIEETQTLAALQTAVVLTLTTTYGLALYIDGERLRADEWTADDLDETLLELAENYPAGSMLTAVQNEPAGSAPAPLEKAKNLSDVVDKATGRANLDVYSRAESNARGRQPGDIFYTARNTAPARSFKANGAAVSRIAYADLFAAIGTRYGAGDGFNTFNLPDDRGEFIRCWDDGRGVDSGRELGTFQAGQNAAHAHSGATDGAGNHAHPAWTGGAGSHSHGASASADGGHTHPLDNRLVTELVPGNGVGGQTSGQSGAIPETGGAGAHGHAITVHGVGDHGHAVGVGEGGHHAHNFNTGTSGGNETRPRNVSHLCCIAY